jgi:hypothetical protein
MQRRSAPEKRVTARSKLPQMRCTGLALPRNDVRNRFRTPSMAAHAWKKRVTAAAS